MKDQAQLYIDQRGSELRALVSEGGQVLADITLQASLDLEETIKDLVTTLTAKSGRKPLQAHLLIADDQVKLSTYQLQEMPIRDVELIIQRGISSATAEKNPIFRLSSLAPQQDKNVYLAEQIPRATITRILQQFKDAGIKLASISTGLQATLASFAPYRDNILQAQAIFDISSDSISATFLSPTDILHLETQLFQDSAVDKDPDKEADYDREIKRRLFAILNVIHGIYSQYMNAHSLYPVEKVWLCGPGSALAGLDESLTDAMDIEVAQLDLLAGKIDNSRPFTPLAGFISAQQQGEQINFIPTEISNPVRFSSKAKAMAVGGFVVLLLFIVAFATQIDIRSVQKQLKKEQSELQYMQAKATAQRSRANSLRFLDQLKLSTPPLYAIFGEIADNFPREIQLDTLDFKHKDQSGSLEIEAVIPYKTPWENDKIFTSLIDSLDDSRYLICKQDPDISIFQENKKKLIKVKVKCQIGSPDGMNKI
jgi:hypothetical protein